MWPVAKAATQGASNLVAEEEKEVHRINFGIVGGVENGFIVRTIRFCDEGKEYVFVERVRALREVGFVECFKLMQLRLVEVIGD